MSSPAINPGHIIAGRYRIGHLLGQGAMGSVYRAVQLSVDRPVALKRLALPDVESQGLIERFEREARALSRLAHPNTVRLFDYGTDERGSPFIVMELLRGCDLAEDLERQGPLRWDQVLRVLQAVAGSLAEAHQVGIVHRDIKPANVFLCAGAAWPSIKVLDFGIAGEIDPAGMSKLTRTGAVVGSAAYMSPEQAQGQSVGAPSDLYALGVLSFEAMTARTPFDSRAFTAQLIAKVLEPAPALREVCPTLDVPEGVEELVRDLLDRDAARRPSSAALIARCAALLARSTLAPLEREVLVARSSFEPPGVAKTEPMRVVQTLEDGWSPPRTGTAPRVRVESGQRRSLGQLLALASLVGALGVGLVWAFGSRGPARESSQTVAPLERKLAAPARNAATDEVGLTAPRAPAPAGASPADETGAGSHVVDEPTLAATPERPPPPAHATPPGATRVPDSADRSTTERPSVERTTERAPPPIPELRRYPNRAAVLQAESAGEITSLERNRLIKGLNALESEALARLRRDVRDGRLSPQELADKAAALELEFDGR